MGWRVSESSAKRKRRKRRVPIEIRRAMWLQRSRDRLRRSEHAFAAFTRGREDVLTAARECLQVWCL